MCIAPVSKVEIAAIESTMAQPSLVNAFRLNAFICLFCRWYDNSPDVAGAVRTFGAVWHLLEIDFQGILVLEFGGVVGYRWLQIIWGLREQLIGL